MDPLSEDDEEDHLEEDSRDSAVYSPELDKVFQLKWLKHVISRFVQLQIESQY